MGRLAAQVADALRVELTRQGLTRTTLAKRLRVSKPYVTKLLSGKENLGLNQLERVAKALGCQVSVAVYAPHNAKAL